jgi:uncharacterized protein (UPF0297 family)
MRKRREIVMKENGKFLFLDPSDSLSHENDLSHEEEVITEVDPDAKAALAELVNILMESGMNPITQLSGYLIAEDPTYLPEGTEARPIARRVGRDKLLEALIELYILYCPTADESDRS